ncbi:uncharacterized protein LOC128632781 [Ictalurus punctatus]|uniref:Uncharacterized protein LOC128632781 n=1 Tax=Ictalurus punctatus TaxID=7998 RepID=A0A9F7TG36_ICTPU|nr:uncharacterized protein LOC128632781 [Ictalurus punctatus]
MEYNLKVSLNQTGNATVPTSPEPPSTINGSAVVQTRLVFNSSSPVLNETAVLSALQALLNSTLSNLTEPVKVLNYTIEEISNTSYAVNITFSISNISMPSNPDLRNNTYTQVENIINNTVNTLLNNFGSDPLKSTTSNFTSSENEVTGYMEYNLKVSLNQTGNATVQTSPEPPFTINGSAVVQTRLVFNSSSPVLNETAVLSALQALLNSTLSNLTEPVKVLNYTIEEISNGSYAVNITFSISNISMPSNPDLRNNTYTQVENIINNTVNTLLNNFGSDPLKLTTSNFTSSEKEVTGYMEYNLKVSLNQTGNATVQTSPEPPSTINGSAVVQTRLVFSSSSPVLHETAILSALEALLNSTLSNLSEPVKVLNYTIEEISNGSYAVNITFSISNISMPSNPDLRNNTYTQVENIINNTVNTFLNNFGSDPLKPTTSNFTSSENEVTGYMEYNLKVSLNQTGNATVPTSPEPPSTINGSAVVQTRLVFNSSSPVLNETAVLSALQALLNSTLSNLTEPVKVLNYTVEEISNTSYAVNITFSISNISMSENPDLRNDTYTQVENIINNALNTLLNEPGAEPFESQSSFFT